jgi:hypothetical protein
MPLQKRISFLANEAIFYEHYYRPISKRNCRSPDILLYRTAIMPCRVLTVSSSPRCEIKGRSADLRDRKHIFDAAVSGGPHPRPASHITTLMLLSHRTTRLHSIVSLPALNKRVLHGVSDGFAVTAVALAPKGRLSGLFSSLAIVSTCQSRSRDNRH